jgi:hypothetical protein
MIRALVGAALPVLGLGLVAAFAGPDLVTGPLGKPLIVDAAGPRSVTQARFSDKECAATYLLDQGADAIDAKRAVRVIAYALRPDGHETELGIRDFPGTAPRETVALLFDESGTLIAAGKPQMPEPGIAAACATSPKSHGQKPV